MKILFISLGCDKNLVDSEVMLGLLASRGYEMIDDEQEADIIVVNTCCFIHDAKQESVDNILEMAEYKKTGKLKALIVTGCLAERYRQEIIDEIPEVDAVLGTTAYDKILDAVDEALEGKHFLEMEDLQALPVVNTKRQITTGGHFAYMKIAEGCDKHCTYCIIPKIRGTYRSVPMEQLIKEAEELAAQGVKELILVAQETTLYGKDLYGEKSLHKLLKELCKVSGIQWIRILYCYPEEITDELIQVIKEEPKICHYLDLPIQHANDEILKRMGRRTSKQELVDIVTKLRKEIPDICLRTTLITGFPGETEEQHQELVEFVDEMEFDRLGVFTYSPEEDTPAATMPDQIEEEVKFERQAELMELQQEVAFDTAEKMIGREMLVMIEGKIADEPAYVGRTYRDAPKVDGLIFVETGELLMSGDFAKVTVTGAEEYDLIGGLTNELTE
ncbi:MULTISPECIES: 30S ribosomal protein S12 methylthiotransferase RimO [Clostridia]|uniref:30S ribosomal protein S12 methylthiotransferase RimO n=1 Tax=Clostridia TaxID=186801 RepID=UPI000EABE373|nr:MULTISPECIES: 30S ribosomal protein S12 methylthiotransferase RimO [Clostridia]RKQ30984.1 30S ribosomal protein S12 methylthiotransferase RimO [Ruminococcus sp. B05]TAP34729.1 30S ribosomal protein S12 methylthiotransferase RimO [Mediterraneibacter sp. gm002]